MEYYRRELLPYVNFTALRTDKFKSGCLSATLLTQLTRERAAENAVLPYVLRRGTAALPDMRALSAKLDGLYGASVEPVVRKLGEIHAVGLRADFPEERLLPGTPPVLEEIVGLVSQLWLAPNTRGGLLLPGYVDGEKQKLIERLEAIRNDRRSWALRRLTENMCACEDYAVSALGSVEEAESIHYLKLTRDYRTLLASSPMEIFYCGSRDGVQVADLLKQAFLLLPRGEIDLELGTDVRMNALEAEPRYFTEEMDISQGNLALGFRLGKCMEDPDEAAIRVFNAVYGGCVTSKLFANVRERLSLCYYASSSVDLLKGLLTVSSGIEFDKYQPALEEILAQLEAVKAGEFTGEELDAARKAVANSLRSVPDDPAALEDFTLRQTIQGLDATPMDIAALAESVTAQEVVDIARGVELDAVYFLRGEVNA